MIVAGHARHEPKKKPPVQPAVWGNETFGRTLAQGHTHGLGFAQEGVGHVGGRNRNFDTGLVSEVFKLTSELEANYQNYGLFVRGTAFYDTQIMDKRNDNDDYRPSQGYPNNNHFTDETRHKAGRDAQILDAYVYGNWDVGDMPLTVKVGNQVFNWGEGIFYRGGINTTNPAIRFNQDPRAWRRIKGIRMTGFGLG